ncbi:hypothetical protein TrRE_jg4930 [Triparma retinervis]|uniref:Uncharacterized protein n=1 Tax=Triparma retinervis TaxID=2557542 RepID=A0A9W7CC69_9STRA|nr:hypothetical protein TrRE_jg4930 [Triparma retinervis]
MASFTSKAENIQGFATIEEAHNEMLECARYGDPEDIGTLRSLVSHSSIDVNYSDSGGSTALHKACANGKKDAVAVLLSHPGCSHTANAAGNTPLHWASSNGEVEIVKMLVDRFKDLDVLAKNSFGKWIAKLCSEGQFEGSSVLELGGGCGVPGIACGVYGNPLSVQITDLTTATLSNLQFNIDLNRGDYGGRTRVESFRLDWADEATYPEGKADSIIGADLVYTDDIVPLLLKVLDGVLAKGGSFFYCAPDDGRAGLKTFIEALRGGGWEVRREVKAEGEYLENPLESKDDEMCFLCFNELGEKRFMFYEFVKR